MGWRIFGLSSLIYWLSQDWYLVWKCSLPTEELPHLIKASSLLSASLSCHFDKALDRTSFWREACSSSFFGKCSFCNLILTRLISNLHFVLCRFLSSCWPGTSLAVGLQLCWSAALDQPWLGLSSLWSLALRSVCSWDYGHLRHLKSCRQAAGRGRPIEHFEGRRYLLHISLLLVEGFFRTFWQQRQHSLRKSLGWRCACQGQLWACVLCTSCCREVIRAAIAGSAASETKPSWPTWPPRATCGRICWHDHA